MDASFYVRELQSVAQEEWSLAETELLFKKAYEGLEWEQIAEAVHHSPESCSKWFHFILTLRGYTSSSFVNIEKIKKRRRKAVDITRIYECQSGTCHKSYGTEGSLKRHMQRKHKDVAYIPSHLLGHSRALTAGTVNGVRVYFDNSRPDQEEGAMPLMVLGDDGHRMHGALQIPVGMSGISELMQVALELENEPPQVHLEVPHEQEAIEDP